MKKVLFLRRNNVVLCAGFLAITFLFNACKKSNDTVHQPVAGLMAFNLIPDKSSIGVAISSQSLTNSPLLYTSYTGGYLGVYAGNRDITAYDFNTRATLATTSQLFADSTNYSVFAVGANGSYRNLIVKDNLDSLSSNTGEAFVRYVNAIADSTKQPLVTISSNGTDAFKDNAAFASVSDFKGVTPGNVSVNVTNESGINSSRTITLEQGKIYTILLVGLAGQTDSTKAVQIKFVQNGTISTTP